MSTYYAADAAMLARYLREEKEAIGWCIQYGIPTYVMPGAGKKSLEAMRLQIAHYRMTHRLDENGDPLPPIRLQSVLADRRYDGMFMDWRAEQRVTMQVMADRPHGFKNLSVA